MISFYSEVLFELMNSNAVEEWIDDVVDKLNFRRGELSYIFCDDKYLLDINVKYLNHSYLTDIISFDYSLGKMVSGDIFISIDRVRENAKEFDVGFEEELHRVMIHGVLTFLWF